MTDTKLTPVLIPHDPYYFEKTMEWEMDNRKFIGNELNNIDDVIDICNKENIKIIFSYSCVHPEFLIKHQKILKDNDIKYCIPGKDIFEAFNDKSKFYKYMIENGFSEYVPKVYDSIKFPCMLKYNISAAGNKSYVINKESDVPFRSEGGPENINFDDYSMTEIIEDNKEYATHIFTIDGEVTMHLTYQYNYNESVYVKGKYNKPISSLEIDIDPNILNVFREIIKKSKYNGEMCIDYKIKDNKPKIFEINPRFGSSLMLSSHYGSFINKYIETCL